MKKNCILILLSFLISCFFAVDSCFSGMKEEKAEKELELRKPQTSPPSYKFAASASIFSGYESNVKLAPIRKGDTFERVSFSMYFSKPLIEKTRLTINYDFEDLNYNKITDASNDLNHLRIGLHRKISNFMLGSGYDLGVLYYPNNEDDFLFHKGFLYVKQGISKRLYQQLLFEYGVKYFTDSKAIADTISTFQEKERRDSRVDAEYSIGSALTKKLLMIIKGRFAINDSNDKYIDFSDYKSYQANTVLDYALLNNLHLFSDLMYIRKNYKTRTITFGDYKERDNFYAGTLGFRYLLNKRNSFTLYYSYRENASNDSTQDFSESLFSCGWRYNF